MARLKGYTKANQKTMKAEYGRQAGKQVSLTAGLSGDFIKAKMVLTADNTEAVKNAVNQAYAKALEKIGWLAEGYAKRLCPVDTGRLRNSIAHKIEVDEKAVYIGTGVEYAAYVELGAKGRKERPYLRPAARDHMAEYTKVVEKELETQ